MTNIGLTCAIFAVLLCSAAAAGPWSTQASEKTFVFRGEPIDPRCVTELVPMTVGKTPPPVDLSRCTKPGQITQQGSTFEIDGSHDDGALETPFDSYTVMARNGERFVVSSEWNSGGTGFFESLLIVRKDGTRLSVEKAPDIAGDRCNGGLVSSAVEGNMLRWSEHITAYDLIKFGGIKTLKAYVDLDDSAAGCVATQYWEYDLDKEVLRPVSISLDAYPMTIDPRYWTKANARQYCFNAYYSGEVAKGHTELERAAIKVFATGYAAACLTNKP